MNCPRFRAGIRRGLQEAIEIVEWEEQKVAPGARPASSIARTRQRRIDRHRAFGVAKRQLFAQLKRHERRHYGRGDPYTGEAVMFENGGGR